MKKTLYRGKNTSFKPMWAIFLVLAILLLNPISAELTTFDNIKQYDEETKTVTIVNTFGVGRDISTTQLDTPLLYKIPRGYRKVYQYSINLFDDTYTNAIGEVVLIDKNNGKEIERQLDYKYLTYKDIEVNDYTEVCNILENGTYYCSQEFMGTHTEQEEVWKDLDTSILIKGKITIGVFTTVQANDYVEWIPTLFGKKIDEWATWVEGEYIETFDTSGECDQVYDVTNYGDKFYTHCNNVKQVFEYWNHNGTYTGVNWDTSTQGTALGITTNGIYFYFSDSTNDQVWVYWFNGTYTGINWDTSGSGNADPWGITNDGTYIYISDSADDRNYKYLLDGTFQDFWSFNVVNPLSYGTLTDGTYIWNIDFTNDKVYRYWVNGTYTSFNWPVENGNNASTGGTSNGTDIWLANQVGGLVFHYKGVEGEPPDNSPTVTLSIPINTTNFTTSDILFGGVVYDDINLINVSLIIDDTYNETNSSGVNNSNYTFTKTLADGDYTWTYEACDNASQCTNGTVRTLTIDSNFPQINIISPKGTLVFGEIGKLENLNVTINDLNLDTCWYDYNGTNTTFSCSTGVQSNETFTLESGNTNITVYANDSLGQENSTFVSWDYRLFLNSEIFVSSVFEGTSSTFSANFLTNGLSITVGNLSYNSEENLGTIANHGGNNFTVSTPVIAPSVSADTNFSFYWNISQGSLFHALTPQNQTVLNFLIDDCSSFNNTIFNFTMYDEEDVNSQLINTTIDYALNFFNLEGSTKIISINDSTQSNPLIICLEKPLEVDLSLTGSLRFFANTSNVNYDVKYYNLLNESITNSTIPKNISLYNINSSKTLSFLLTFRDSGFTLSPNILVKIDRQFLPSNDFKTVEIPLTDSNGQATLNLVRNVAVYNFIMINSSRKIVASFNNVVAFCQDFTIQDCSIDLNAESIGDLSYSYNEDVGISYTTSYSNGTKLISVNFNSLNNSNEDVSVRVYVENQFENQTICDDSLVGTSGTINCDISSRINTNQFFFVEISNGGKQVSTETINANPALSKKGGAFGSNGYFIAFLLMLVFILLFSDDKQILTIILGVGWVAILSLGLIKGAIFGAASGGVWLVITIIIFIWKLKKEEILQ